MSTTLIKRVRENRARLWEQMKALTDSADEEKRDLSQEEWDQWARMNSDMQDFDSRVDELEEHAKRSASMDAQRDGEATTGDGQKTKGEGSARRSAEATLRNMIAELRTRERSHFDVDLTAYRRHIDPNGIVSIEPRGADDPETRDLTVGTSTAGGDTVPTEFSRRLWEHLIEDSAIRRTNVTILTTAGGEAIELPKTTSHSSVSAITAEAAAIAEDDPAFAKVTLNAYKYGVVVQISRELLEDTGVDLLDYLAREMAAAVNNGAGAHYVTGDGSSKPNGIVTASTLGVTGGAGVAGAFTGDNLIDLQYSVIEKYARNGRWMMRRATEGEARKLKDSNNQYLWAPGLQPGQPNSLLGDPVTSDPNVAAVALSAKSVIYGDFSRYVIRDVGAIRVERSDDFAFTSDLATFKATLRTDGDLVDVTGAVKHFIGNAA